MRRWQVRAVSRDPLFEWSQVTRRFWFRWTAEWYASMWNANPEAVLTRAIVERTS